MENPIKNIHDKVTVQRGDIYFVDLGKGIGSEQNSLRPSIIISNNRGNLYSNVVCVIPLTSSKTKRPLPTHVLIDEESLPQKSTALTEQIRVVDKKRLLDKIGKCSQDTMTKLDKAIKISLAINDVNVESVNNYRNNLAPLKFDTDRAKDLGIAINKIENIINTSNDNLIDLECTINVLLYELKFYCSGFDKINYRFFYKPIPRIIRRELAQKLG